MDYIKNKFKEIEDNRHWSYTEHKLENVLIIIMCAVLCGLDGLASLVIYAQNKKEFFERNFEIEKIPSKSTFSRILNMVNGDDVANVIIEIMLEKATFLGDILAVDGKAIRSTSEKGKPHSALQILTAYLTESSIVLGQKAIHEKTNEIPVFQEMLDNINVEGKTITADAMHCQKETCKKIVENGGNYVFGLKENQKLLYEDVKLFLNSKINSNSIEIYETIEKNGGRIEKRICKKTTDINWLESQNEWIGLKSIFSIQRIITSKNKTTDEICFYITNLDTQAKELLRIAREHWKIESLHWLLDVTFSEDECEMLSENGHKTLNILRKLALLLHKKYLAKQPKKCSVKANLLNCLLNENLICNILGNL